MSALEKLLPYFPTGTAEGERAILDQVFIYADEFNKTVSPPPGNPYLLVGNKGSGKSALIDFSVRLAEKQSVPVVALTPVDIDCTPLATATSTGDMVRVFHGILLATIANKLSEQDTGWFDGDYATLYQEAVVSGNRSPDIFGRLARFFSAIAKPVLQVDLNEAFPHLTSATREDVGKAAAKVLQNKAFYLYIDDTDQIANPDQPGHLNRIWALILAVRRLSGAIPELKAIVTLRSEVWDRLQHDTAGQRDQTDHFKTLVVKMHTSRLHVQKILERRLSLAAAQVQSESDPYAPFFEGREARAPYSESFRSWSDLIIVRSRDRPRDAIQLVNALAQRAANSKKEKIDEPTFHLVMPEFSKQISGQFAQEVELECPQAFDILRSFARAEYDMGGFTMSADNTLDHFRKIPSRFSVQVHGNSISPTRESDIFELWRFFYNFGVINARISDITQKDGFRHLEPSADTMLVSKSRWNDLQAMLWEISAVYRDFLISLQQQDSVRIGIPLKAPRKRR